MSIATMDDYRALVAGKRARFAPRGLDPQRFNLRAALKPHQAHAVRFGLAAGTAGIFYDTGLGKSFIALEWGDQIAAYSGKPVLMLAPLAVAPQHEAEAERFGIDAAAVREPWQAKKARVVITNYERLDRFAGAIAEGAFGGVILDESSILKSFTGATTRALIAAFAATPFRLACTATPAPNDHTELGQHAEFLGVMRSSEMLSRFFINDSMNAGRYRLKRPAVRPFWGWVASWARAVSRPSDLGFDDAGYDLPPLNVVDHLVRADIAIDVRADKTGQGMLFRIPEASATSIHREKRLTLAARADAASAAVAAQPSEAWIVWVETDAEEEAMTARLPGAVAVRGSQRPEVKEERLTSFTRGGVKILITKPSIAGFGLNWQHCARQCFVGLSFSYESYYQAIRRCWRFGQTRAVEVHVVGADTERAVRATIARKEGDHAAMKDEMRAAMSRASAGVDAIETYEPGRAARLPTWMAA